MDMVLKTPNQPSPLPLNVIMFSSPQKTLKIMAALIWYIGVVVLFTKSSGLFIEAKQNGIHIQWVILASISGIIIGLVKAKYFFIKICNKNLKRIRTLKNPKIWQCYRTSFFIFLGLMVTLSSQFYAFAEGNGIALLLLATVELSVGTALLASASCFFGELQEISNKKP